MGVFLVITTALCALVALFKLYERWAFSYWKKLGVPGPTPRPLVKTLTSIFTSDRYIGDYYVDVYRAHPKEKFVGVYMATKPALLVRDLDLLKHIFVKDFATFPERGISFSEENLGSNLFHADGETWNLLRKRISPIYSSGKIKNMFYIISECSAAFNKVIREDIGTSGELEMHSMTSRYALNVICATAFGLNANAFDKNFNILVDTGEKIFRCTWQTALSVLAPDYLKLFNASTFPSDVRDYFYKLVNQVTQEREGKAMERRDFIDLLLELKAQEKLEGIDFSGDKEVSVVMNDAVMTAQVVLFFAAGYETTSNTMAHLLYEFALNQDVQEKAFEEVKRVYEKHGYFTYESLSDLVYLDMAFYETLRKHPIVDPLQRLSVEKFTIPDTSITLPKGTMVIVSTLGLHRDPKIWPDPEKFDPERFSPQNRKTHHPMAFLSFGDGPRACIGARFAKVKGLLGLANFIREFHVETCGRTKTLRYNEERIVRSPKDGFYLKVTKRKA